MNSVTSLFGATILLVIGCTLSSASALPAANCTPVSTSASTEFTTDSLSKSVPTCAYLKNVFFKEYLFTMPSQNNDSNNDVFTRRNKTSGPASAWGSTLGEQYKYQGLWLIEKDNCTSCYTIKSVSNKTSPQTLFSMLSVDPKFKFSRPRRPVFTYSKGPKFYDHDGQGTWRIEPVYDNRLLLKSTSIEHQRMGEVLYAVSDSNSVQKDRREVFTWTSHHDSDAYGDQGEWIIEKAVCPPWITIKIG